MKEKLNESFINNLTQKIIKNKHVNGAVFCVESHDASISFVESVGDIKSDDQYFIASVTKLYITAIMLILKNDNKLSFDDKIMQYFDHNILDKR